MRHELTSADLGVIRKSSKRSRSNSSAPSWRELTELCTRVRVGPKPNRPDCGRFSSKVSVNYRSRWAERLREPARGKVRNVGRKKRTPDELRRISEDLHYEVQMLLGSAQGLDPETTAEGTLHNALVESFAIHLRNMLDFLWPDKPKRKSDWVIAADFFPSPSDWEKLRPEISQLLLDSRGRAARKLHTSPTHVLRLTLSRKTGTFAKLRTK
jgi:hypothetical protein